MLILIDLSTQANISGCSYVSQVSPTSGLVSILKKRKVCLDDVSASSSSDPRPEKPTAKRRVRFKVPDDHYEPGMFFVFYCRRLKFRIAL